jgi:hypothetical protein
MASEDFLRGGKPWQEALDGSGIEESERLKAEAIAHVDTVVDMWQQGEVDPIIRLLEKLTWKQRDQFSRVYPENMPGELDSFLDAAFMDLDCEEGWFRASGGGPTLKNTVDMIWKQLPVAEQPVKPANPHDRTDEGRIAQETFRQAVIRAGENYVARKPNLRNTKGKLIWEIIEGRLEQIPAISSRSEAEVMDPASENPEIG